MQEIIRHQQKDSLGEVDMSAGATVEGRSTIVRLGMELHKFTIFSPDFICRLKPSAEAMTARTTVSLIIMLKAAEQVC